MSDEFAKELEKLDDLQKRLESLESSRSHRIFAAMVSAALSSVPWLGGVLAAGHGYFANEHQHKTDTLQRQWLEEHQRKLRALAVDLADVVTRLSSLGQDIQDRIESEEYLALVRKAFRTWDSAETAEKREYVKRLICNAAGSKLCPDDLIRLFLDWLDRYHEAHFLVIREIYKSKAITKYEIWLHVNGEFPQENSSEADLFRLLIMDLSFGHVIRQHREVTSEGQFLPKRRSRARSSGVMKSAFDDEEMYELTELGRQFVHYVFTDIVTRLSPESS